MTLLTPAVLHCSALEYVKSQDKAFHRRYIIQFALMQGLWGVILWILAMVFIAFPMANELRQTSEKILTNANFSSVTIKDGKATIDIKPLIWPFTIRDSERERVEFVVDTTGHMNKFYWDDRVEKGQIKQINGAGLTPEYIFVKKGTWMKKMYFKNMCAGCEVTFSKQQVYEKSMNMLSSGTMLRVVLYAIPLVFAVFMLLGAIMHIVFILVVGALLKVLTRNFVATKGGRYKIASALYVGWAYVMALSLISQKILLLTLGDASRFFMVVEAVVFVTLVFIGYLCIGSFEKNIHELPITKVRRLGYDKKRR